MSKEILMTAEEFSNCQAYLGLNIDQMAKAVRRQRRSIDNYRKTGVTDGLVCEKVETLVKEKTTREMGMRLND